MAQYVKVVMRQYSQCINIPKSHVTHTVPSHYSHACRRFLCSVTATTHITNLTRIWKFVDFVSHSFIQRLSTVQWFSLKYNQVSSHVPVSSFLSWHSTSILFHPTSILCVFFPSVRIPVGAGFSATVLTGPGANPASYTKGTVSLPGVKRPERSVDHPPQPAARLKKSRAFSLLPHWVFVAYSRVKFTFTFPSFVLHLAHFNGRLGGLFWLVTTVSIVVVGRYLWVLSALKIRHSLLKFGINYLKTSNSSRNLKFIQQLNKFTLQDEHYSALYRTTADTNLQGLYEHVTLNFTSQSKGL